MAKKGAAKPKAKAAAPSAAPPGGGSAPAAKAQEELEAEELKKLYKQQAEAKQAKALQSQAEDQRRNEKKAQWEKWSEKEQREKAREDKKWEKELAAAQARAKTEGVMEAQEAGDGTLWVELGNKTWKEVQDYWWCSLCDKHLNGNTLQAHLDSDNHKKKLAWQQPTPCSAAAFAAPKAAAPPAAAAPPPKAAAPAANWCPPCGPVGQLEPWQEWAEAGIRCLPCNKIFDECHAVTDDHKRRLANWLESEQARKNGRPPPELPYLAWMPWDETQPDGEKCLKCLLCQKWVQDEWSHSGTPAAPAGSKDHRKYVANYPPGTPWYQENVVAVRRKWHPEASAGPATRVPRPAPAAPATAAPWGKASPAAAAPAAAAPAAAWGKAPAAAAPATAWAKQPAAAGPWAKASASSTAQPARAAPVPPPVPGPPPLPDGWACTKTPEGKTYYFHRETDKVQWDFPEEEEEEEVVDV